MLSIWLVLKLYQPIWPRYYPLFFEEVVCTKQWNKYCALLLWYRNQIIFNAASLKKKFSCRLTAIFTPFKISVCVNSEWLFVLVSYGCCNKLPQTGWLKTIRIYFLIVWESRSPNQFHLTKTKVWARLQPPPEALRKNPSLDSFSSSGCWHSLACDHITPTSASGLTLSYPPLCQPPLSSLL